VITNPNHQQLGRMWGRAKQEHKNLIILATLPDGTDVGGFVIGRGSKYSIQDPETGVFIEDIRPEWIYSATLTPPYRRAE
jgi:hypothetical protein